MTRTFLRTSRHSRAFTMIELIVVIVILGLLAAIAAVSYQAVITNSQRASLTQTGTQFDKEARALAAFSQDAPSAHSAAATADLPSGWTVSADTTDPRKVLLKRNSDGAWVCDYLSATYGTPGEVAAIGLPGDTTVTSASTCPVPSDAPATGQLEPVGGATPLPSPSPSSTSGGSTGSLSGGSTTVTGGTTYTGNGSTYAHGVIYNIGTANGTQAWTNPAKAGYVTLAASGQYYPANQAVDTVDQTNPSYEWDAGGASGYWQIDFGSTHTVTLNQFYLDAGNLDSGTTLQASTDGKAWTTLWTFNGTYAGQDVAQKLAPTVSSSTGWRYLKVNRSAVQGGWFYIDEFEVYGTYN